MHYFLNFHHYISMSIFNLHLPEKKSVVPLNRIFLLVLYSAVYKMHFHILHLFSKELYSLHLFLLRYPDMSMFVVKVHSLEIPLSLYPLHKGYYHLVLQFVLLLHFHIPR
jgi:hypothetical protein